jgi:hypothetical protein
LKAGQNVGHGKRELECLLRPNTPKIDAILAKGIGDIGIAKHFEAAPFSTPPNAIRGHVPLMRVIELPKGSKCLAKVDFGLFLNQ